MIHIFNQTPAILEKKHHRYMSWDRYIYLRCTGKSIVPANLFFFFLGRGEGLGMKARRQHTQRRRDKCKRHQHSTCFIKDIRPFSRNDFLHLIQNFFHNLLHNFCSLRFLFFFLFIFDPQLLLLQLDFFFFIPSPCQPFGQ